MRARYASTTSVGERRLAWMAAESSCTMKEVGSLWGIGGFAVEGGGMAGQEPRRAMASNPQRRSRDLPLGRGAARPPCLAAALAASEPRAALQHSPRGRKDRLWPLPPA